MSDAAELGRGCAFWDEGVSIGICSAAAALDLPLSVTPVHRQESNALALPGGRPDRRSRNTGQLAGVLAHEIGHVVHRDGTRAVLQQAGLLFLFGMLLGDFVGGGAVIVAARSVLQSSYSREQEAAAGAYAIGLMRKVWRSAGAREILGRIGEATEPGMKILRDHPDTKARIDTVNRLSAPTTPTAPFISIEDWAAPRGICKG